VSGKWIASASGVLEWSGDAVFLHPETIKKMKMDNKNLFFMEILVL
jgi:hypothetical protein